MNGVMRIRVPAGFQAWQTDGKMGRFEKPTELTVDREWNDQHWLARNGGTEEYMILKGQVGSRVELIEKSLEIGEVGGYYDWKLEFVFAELVHHCGIEAAMELSEVLR